MRSLAVVLVALFGCTPSGPGPDDGKTPLPPTEPETPPIDEPTADPTTEPDPL